MRIVDEITRTHARNTLIRWRGEHRAQLRANADPAIARRLVELLGAPPYDAIDVLGVYWPIRDEPDLASCYAHWLHGGRRLALPRIGADGALEFGRWHDDAELRAGRFAIPVPEPFDVVAPGLLVVPCVGFDVRGYRLGYGGGHYDRTLAARGLPAVGVAYDGCELHGFEAAAHDRPLDAIVTESRSIRRS